LRCAVALVVNKVVAVGIVDEVEVMMVIGHVQVFAYQNPVIEWDGKRERVSSRACVRESERGLRRSVQYEGTDESE
jgi:hypothetical protein